MISRKLVKAFLFVSPLVVMSGAHAALVDCTADLASNPDSRVENTAGTTTAASDCQYISPADQNNVASVANINAAQFFGSSNWTGNNGQVQISVNDIQAGTWTIAGADFANFDYMIVFKDGANTNLVGFLFNELFTTGSWTTPFTNPPFSGIGENQSKGVSHYTIVQRPDTPTDVPEPGVLALMGLGLAGFAATRRRSAKK